MEKPKQYTVFKDKKFICETDRPAIYPEKQGYTVYIDTRYFAKLRLYNYMTKKEKEALKARKSEILRAQIEKLINSREFELPEIVDIFQEVCDGSRYVGRTELTDIIEERAADTCMLIKDLDLIQEHELKQFCKEKGVKIYG